ncbi:MAG: hypothetical protein OHK0038_00280 [Flammeovirgaceae bacterium]
MNLGESAIRNITNPKVADMVRQELKSDEKLLWCAQPTSKRYFRKGLPFFFFGIFFAGFAIFWTVMAASITGASSNETNIISYIFPLFGIPFIVVGVGMLTAPLWMAYKVAKETAYLITDQRAILIEGGLFSGEVRYYPPQKLKDFFVRREPNNVGDIILETKISTSKKGGQTTTEYGFLGIENLTEVSTLLQKLSEKSD